MLEMSIQVLYRFRRSNTMASFFLSRIRLSLEIIYSPNWLLNPSRRSLQRNIYNLYVHWTRRNHSWCLVIHKLSNLSSLGDQQWQNNSQVIQEKKKNRLTVPLRPINHYFTILDNLWLIMLNLNKKRIILNSQAKNVSNQPSTLIRTKRSIKKMLYGNPYSECSELLFADI